MRNIEFRHLRYFVAVAEELSFSKAASRLHISQPPLSQQIKALEEELGIQLFERNKREVHLTEAGKVFLSESTRLLSGLETAVGTTIRAATSDRGNLKIGLVTSALFHLLPAIQARVSNHFPEIELSIYDMSSKDQVEALVQERLDIGIIHSCPAVKGLNKVPIYSEPFVLALPDGHELDRCQSISVSQLEHYRLIGFSRDHSPSLHDAQMACCLAKGFRPELIHHARTPLAIFQLIRAGMGISLVPRPYSRSTYPGITFRELDDCVGRLHLYAIWKEQSPSDLVQKVTQTIMLETMFA